MEGNKPFLGRKPIIKLLVSISRVAFFVDVDKAAGSQAGQSTIRQAARYPGRQAGRHPEAGSKSGNQIQTKPETRTRTTATPPLNQSPLWPQATQQALTQAQISCVQLLISRYSNRVDNALGGENLLINYT